MIVDGMDIRSISAYILEERKLMSGSIDKCYRKFCSEVLTRNRTRFPIARTYEFRSPRKITFFVSFFAAKRGDHRNPKMAVAGTYMLSDGQYGFSIIQEKEYPFHHERVVIRTPHYLKRYRERELRNCGVITSEVIKACTNTGLEESYAAALRKEHSLKMDRYAKEGTRQLMVSTGNGYSIAEEHDRNTIVLKTYITKDMLSELQRHTFEENDKKHEQMMAMIRMLNL